LRPAKRIIILFVFGRRLMYIFLAFPFGRLGFCVLIYWCLLKSRKKI